MPAIVFKAFLQGCFYKFLHASAGPLLGDYKMMILHDVGKVAYRILQGSLK